LVNAAEKKGLAVIVARPAKILVRQSSLAGRTSLSFVSYLQAIRGAYVSQTLGSVAVLGAFAGAEAVAHLLDYFPANEWLWFLNNELFRVFTYARQDASPLSVLFTPWALVGAGVMLALAVFAHFLRLKLAVALVANISFVFVANLAYAWFRGVTAYQSASLLSHGVGDTGDAFLIFFLLSISFYAFVTSHVLFIRDSVARRSFTAGG
jgi:hypothetical protein